VNWTTVRINDWRSWQDAVEGYDLSEQSNPGWWFRGQADSDWTLEPSLRRAIKGLDSAYARAHGIELGALRRFQDRAHLFLPSDGVDRSKWKLPAWWALMQHFGCPTRLLDWTESPYVALYFAAISETQADGALWAFPASLVSTNVSSRYGPLEHQVWDGEDGLFEAAVYPAYLLSHNDRSASQQACFTVCVDIFAEHSKAIETAVDDIAHTLALTKLIIPRERKLDFLSRLRTMNITAASLFPGLDGLGRSAAEYIRLRAWRSVEGQRNA